MKYSQLRDLRTQVEELSIRNVRLEHPHDLVTKHESDLTINQLKELLDKELVGHEETDNTPPAVLERLSGFLRDRWDRIQDTNSEYNAYPSLPANQSCLALAKILEQESLGTEAKKSRYEYLMPTLEAVKTVSWETMLELATDELEPLAPSHFILSDDKKRFIPIVTCLEYAGDGILRHLCPMGEETTPPPLTKSEIRRLTSSSPEAKAYYDAIMELHRFRTEGGNIGAALNNLIQGLKGGGAHQGGEEFNAGEAANTAILRFAHFLDALNEEDKEFLFRCTGTTQQPFAEFWERLTNPTQYSDTIYCVELISSALETILENHQELYERATDSSRLTERRKKLERQLTEAKDAFNRSQIQQRTTIPQQQASLYDETCFATLLKRILPNLDIDSKLATIDDTPDSLIAVLNSIPQPYRLMFISTLSRENLKYCLIQVSLDRQFPDLLNTLTEQDQTLFFNYLKSFSPFELYEDVFDDGDELISVLETFPEEKRLEFLRNINISIIMREVEEAHEKLIDILETLPEENLLAFLNEINIYSLITTSSTIRDNLSEIIEILPERDQAIFLTRLKQFISDSPQAQTALPEILENLPEKYLLEFIEHIKPLINTSPNIQKALPGILDNLPEETRIKFLSKINFKQLFARSEDLQSVLPGILETLPEASRIKFLNNINFKQLFARSKELQLALPGILETIPEEARIKFLNNINFKQLFARSEDLQSVLPGILETIPEESRIKFLNNINFKQLFARSKKLQLALPGILETLPEESRLEFLKNINFKELITSSEDIQTLLPAILTHLPSEHHTSFLTYIGFDQLASSSTHIQENLFDILAILPSEARSSFQQTFHELLTAPRLQESLAKIPLENRFDFLEKINFKYFLYHEIHSHDFQRILPDILQSLPDDKLFHFFMGITLNSLIPRIEEKQQFLFATLEKISPNNRHGFLLYIDIENIMKSDPAIRARLPEILSMIIPTERTEFLTNIINLNEFINNYDDIKRTLPLILTTLSPEDRLDFITTINLPNILQTLPSEDRLSFLTDVIDINTLMSQPLFRNKIIDILKLLPETKRLGFLTKINMETISTFLHHEEQMLNIFRLLPKLDRFNFINLIPAQKLPALINSSNLMKILELLPQEQRLKFLGKIQFDSLISKHREIRQQLPQILEVLPQEQRLEFLENIQFNSLISRHENIRQQLPQILEKLPQEQQAEFLKTHYQTLHDLDKKTLSTAFNTLLPENRITFLRSLQTPDLTTFLADTVSLPNISESLSTEHPLTSLYSNSAVKRRITGGWFFLGPKLPPPTFIRLASNTDNGLSRLEHPEKVLDVIRRNLASFEKQTLNAQQVTLLANPTIAKQIRGGLFSRGPRLPMDLFLRATASANGLATLEHPEKVLDLIRYHQAFFQNYDFTQENILKLAQLAEDVPRSVYSGKKFTISESLEGISPPSEIQIQRLLKIPAERSEESTVRQREVYRDPRSRETKHPPAHVTPEATSDEYHEDNRSSP